MRSSAIYYCSRIKSTTEDIVITTDITDIIPIVLIIILTLHIDITITLINAIIIVIGINSYINIDTRLILQ